jgi:hypothetical protein
MRLAQRLLRIKGRDLVMPRPYGQAGVRAQPEGGLFAAPCCARGEWHELHVEHRTTTLQSLSSGFWKFLWKTCRTPQGSRTPLTNKQQDISLPSTTGGMKRPRTVSHLVKRRRQTRRVPIRRSSLRRRTGWPGRSRSYDLPRPYGERRPP